MSSHCLILERPKPGADLHHVLFVDLDNVAFFRGVDERFSTPRPIVPPRSFVFCIVAADTMLNVAIGKSPGYFHLVQRHGIEICPLGSWRPPFVLPPGEASNTMSPCQALQRLVRWAHTVLDPAISFTLLYFPEDSASETSLQDYLQGRDVETIRPARHHWWDRVASRLARRKPQPPKVKTSEPSPRREGEEEAESGVENPIENRERIEPSALTEEALRSWGIGMAEPELNGDAGEGKEKGELFRQESRKVEDRCILDTSEVVKERSFSVEPTCDIEVPKTAGDKLSTTERPTVLEPVKQVPERALPPTEDVATTNTKDPHIAETSSHRKPYREVPKRSKKKVKEPVPVESYNPVTSLLLNMSEPETSRSRKRRQHPELATMDSFRANDMFPSEQRDLSPIEKGTTQEIHPGPIDKHSSPQYQGRDALRSSTHHPHAHQHRHRHHHHHHHHHERRSHHTREQCPTHDHPIQSKEHKGFPARDAERHRDARKHRAHTHNESDSDSLSSAEASDMSSDFSSSASRQSSLSRSLSSLSSDLTASSICSNSLRTKLIAATKKKY